MLVVRSFLVGPRGSSSFCMYLDVAVPGERGTRASPALPAAASFSLINEIIKQVEALLLPICNVYARIFH